MQEELWLRGGLDQQSGLDDKTVRNLSTVDHAHVQVTYRLQRSDATARF